MITEDGDGAVVLAVYVQPGARRDALVGPHGDALKVRVAAPPEDGRANKAVVALLAATLGVPARSVSVIAGEHSRSKRVRIEGVDAAALVARLPAS